MNKRIQMIFCRNKISLFKLFFEIDVEETLNASNMKKSTFFSSVFTWLKTSEMFIRPSKLLPGNWELYEYFIDEEDDLENIKQENLKEKALFWKIQFNDDGNFMQQNNLNVPLLNELQNGTWSVTKNFITLIHPDNFRNNIEFQFAIEKGILKILNKNSFGKIEFFGFFKKPV